MIPEAKKSYFRKSVAFISNLSRPSINFSTNPSTDNLTSSLLTKYEIHWGYKIKKLKFLIEPHSIYKKIWDVFVIFLVFFNAMSLPYEFGFDPDLSSAYKAISHIVDVIFVIDIIINFLTTFEDSNTHFYVNDYGIVAKCYLNSWFFVDLLAVLPYELVSSEQRFWSILKNVRLLRMSKIFKQIRQVRTSSASNMIRLSWMVILFCLVIHWFACFFSMAALYKHNNGEDNNWMEYYSLWEQSRTTRYITALYWSSMSVTTGYGDIVAQNNLERLVNCTTMVIGALIYAVIFGNISLTIANINRDETNYQDIVNALIAHMEDLALPTELRKKILSYNDYVWAKNKGKSEDDYLRDIPRRVQVEVAVLVHGRMLRSNILFADAPDSFINAAALALRFTVCLPNEYVFQEGDIADSVVFVGRGQVGVFREEYGSLCVLEAGALFGEAPLMLELNVDDENEDANVNNYRRMVTSGVFSNEDEGSCDNTYHKREFDVHSLSVDAIYFATYFRIYSVRGYAFCDLWKMDYHSFLDIILKFPDLHKIMGNIALERVKQTVFYEDEQMIHSTVLGFAPEIRRQPVGILDGQMQQSNEQKNKRASLFEDILTIPIENRRSIVFQMNNRNSLSYQHSEAMKSFGNFRQFNFSRKSEVESINNVARASIINSLNSENHLNTNVLQRLESHLMAIVDKVSAMEKRVSGKKQKSKEEEEESKEIKKKK